MRKPLEAPDAQSRQQITLYAHAVPQSHYTVRPESFGPVLICGGRVLPISSGALAFLEHVDGRYTLAQIEREHGDQALSFLGGLYLQQFISFHVQDVSSSAGGI